MLLVMLSACILPNALYRNDQLELTTAPQAHEDGISDESGTDSEDESLMRRRRMQRSKRSRTLEEQTVRRNNFISCSTTGFMYI